MGVPLAAFAIATPFIVNGLASAINSQGSKSSVPASATSNTAVLATVLATVPATAPATAPAIVPTTVPTASTTIVIPGVEPTADARTVALGAEIVSEVTPTSAAAPVTTGGATPTTVKPGSHSHGGVITEVALTRAERKGLAAQLIVARQTALEYPTVADAEAAGYTKVTGYVPLIGAHYIKWSLMDGNFNVAEPEMLLYDGTDPTSSIVGLSYYMFSDTEPSPFIGPNDHWHQHIGLCLKSGVVVGGESTTQEECSRRGGVKAAASNGWMVHAWVVPGWESPQGVFSPEHPGLTADLATT